MKKNILITGTSTGVGFESSILFSQNGFKVYATMRNLEKSDALKEKIAAENLDIEILQLDVTDNTSIKTAVDTIISKDGKIDILLNNAGAGFAKTLEQSSQQEIDWVMRKEKGGHIINVTSVGGLVGQPFNELYCGAKFAVEGFTEALATYVSKPFGINFSIVEPGGIATAFMNNAIAKTANEKGEMATGDYAPIFQKYLEGAQSRAGSDEESPYQTGREVADVILKVAQTENPPLRIRSSKWAENMCDLKTKGDPDGTQLVNRIREYFL